MKQINGWSRDQDWNRKHVLRPRPHKIGLECFRDQDCGLEDYIPGYYTDTPLTVSTNVDVIARQYITDYVVV